MMKPVSLSLPELGLIAGTRAALGAGVALLLADQLSAEQRRAVGWTLVAVGVISTVPLLAEVFGQVRSSSSTDAT
jgi:EamA domain-containing membrane protein RarD